MTTLSYSSQSMVPSVPYVKAVDCYLIVSFFFVFGALLEYAIILNVQLRHSKSKQNKVWMHTRSGVARVAQMPGHQVAFYKLNMKMCRRDI